MTEKCWMITRPPYRRSRIGRRIWRPKSPTWRRPSTSWSRKRHPFRNPWMSRRQFQRITKKILQGPKSRPLPTGKKSSSRMRRYSSLPPRRNPNGQKRKKRREELRRKAVRRKRADKRKKAARQRRIRKKRANPPKRRSRKRRRNRNPRVLLPHLPARLHHRAAARQRAARLPILPASLSEILMYPAEPA